MIKISMHLDNRLEIPVYAQIKKNIEQGIREGQLQAGCKLPSINKMVSGFKLAPGTVIRAYNELRELGIISSKQGKDKCRYFSGNMQGGYSTNKNFIYFPYFS